MGYLDPKNVDKKTIGKMMGGIVKNDKN